VVVLGFNRIMERVCRSARVTNLTEGGAHLIIMAVALGQWSCHSVQKVLCEGCRLSPACPVNYPLAACKVLLEAAAKLAHTLLTMAANAEHLVLVVAAARVILFLDLSHTRGMAQV